MKQYFVKFCHVKGEIEPGDWIIFTNILNPVPIQWLGGGDKKSNEIFKNAKKLKPFLCSKKGDFLYDNEDKYRIIGEISSAARWVKEGDRFDDTEIEKWVMYGNQPLIYIEGHTNYDLMFIKIKCPICQIFH